MSDDGEELRLPPRRIIRRVTALVSTSDSESDDGVVALSSRRKRMRVVSDEDTDSSGSSVGRPFTRRIRMLPQLRDSDNASNASDDDSRNQNASAAGPATHASGFASDSSEGNSEKCSICLMRFTDQEVGTPQTCEHIFCLDCITEWSKSVNTCPVDRITFNSIVVRACAGGRVLRTEPVNVMPRRSSVDTILLFDSRVCQICGDTDNEETMLLCDGCDLGYHMQCLTPPLSQIPVGDWHCPYCENGIQDEDIYFDDLMPNIDVDFFCPMGLRPSPLRAPRNIRRSNRYARSRSTSVHHRAESSEVVSAPSTSHVSRSIAGSSSYSTTRRSTNGAYAPRRRKYKKRRTKTVILEYEVENNSKCPVVKKYRRKIKKKVKKRQSRTVARQRHVRESVRAKLATLKMNQRQGLSEVSMASNEVQNLCIRRQRAGIPSLSILGNPNELDYFSEDEHEVSEGASTAIAIRSTSNLLNAHRQTRRKMVTIPSPPHASSAPDFLSSILESQTLLHSKKSVLSISVDGNVNIKLETNGNNIQKKPLKNEQEARLDLSKGVEGAKQAPSYPGHSRGGGGGGGGWGGGYRGNYHRERGTTGFGRGSYNEGDYPGGPQNRQGNHFHRNDAGHREETEMFSDYARRSHRIPAADEPHFDRNRRYSDSNRGFAHSGSRQNDVPSYPTDRTHLTEPVHSAGAVSWRPYGAPPAPRPPAPLLHRHSFGGFDDPLDMRTGGIQSQVPLRSPLQRPDSFMEEARLPALQPCRPLPDPPVFNFDTGTDLDKSEDERSDPDLVIDTDKYDPTEPTNDDDSPDEETLVPAPLPQLCTRALSPPPLPPEPPQADALRGALSGLDVNVPPAILDNAVRQVLHEHRDLLVQQPPPNTGAEGSDEDSDGDCPNFSIYSATSVHIANNTSVLTAEQPPQLPRDDLEDLVQEDDDSPSPTLTPDSTTATQTSNVDLDVSSKSAKPLSSNRHYNFDYSVKKKSEEYKEKVSKRCPITTNTRNPIKIKLNTPSLIKRPVSLYDDDEDETEEEPPETQTPELLSKTESSALTQNPLVNFCNVSVELSEQQSVAADEKISENVEEHNCVENNKVDAMNELKDKENVVNDINKFQTVVNKQSDDEAHITTVDNIKVDKMEHLNLQEEKLNGPSENSKTLENEGTSDNASEQEEHSPVGSPPTKRNSLERSSEVPEKMTESISETEDERSYTPCLDENKSKDTSLETDKDKRIEGLDTEMISEDEGNEMFSDEDEAHSEKSRASPSPVPVSVVAEEEPPSVKKQVKPDSEPKKKKKKDSKKEGKDRGKTKRKTDVVFRKLSKSGKERNYREREKQAAERERRGSSPSAEREKKKRKRKEKRKDLERYDVRTVVGDKRRKRKDAFGRDVSPRVRSRSPSLSSPRCSPTPRRRSPSLRRRSITPRRRSPTPRRSSPLQRRRSTSPHRGSPTPRRRSLTPRRRSPSLRRRSATPRHRSPTPRRRSPTPRRRSPTPARCSPSAARVSFSPIPRRRRSQSAGGPSLSPGRGRRSRSPRSISPRATSPRRLRPSMTRGRRPDPRPDPRPDTRRRRGEPERVRKRRRSASASRSPRPKSTKRKKRTRSERATPRRRKSPRRRRARRRSAARAPEPSPGPAPASSVAPAAWSPASLESRPPSPCTPPPALDHEDAPRRRRDFEHARHRRTRDAGGASKEVFTSGDNILVSVSFKEQERGEDSERKSRRKERRRRKRRPTAPESDGTAVRPVAIIDLERSPFRELTPSPRDVIVLSDSDAGEREASEAPSAPAPPQQTSGAAPTPAETSPAPAPEERGPTTPPDPPDSPDAYDPYEPTRSASGSPSPAPPASPPRTAITLETAQKTNMSADEVIDRRPLSPIEKVMALLQSTREVSPEPPPQEPSPAELATSTATVAPSLAAPPPAAALAAAAPAPALAPPVRIVLPEASRATAPKLFLAKPSPIKSDPIKPMPKPSRAPVADADSPYSPGSSDFGELFSPPGGARRDPFDALVERAARRAGRNAHGGRSAARVPVRLDRKQGKTQVGVKIDEDNLKILDDLPSSAVEMQVKSKFLKKLNRQERVVEEVKLVLKPHYNKKHVTKDEYKDILRRAVPKICHNKSGEINPTKIQALIEAYVKKIRKKHKLGLL